MEFNGVQVSLDVATGLGLFGALFGWLLRKWHEDRMAKLEKAAQAKAELEAAQERDDALVIRSLEPLNQAIQALYFELRKTSPDMAKCQKLLSEVEVFYTQITVSAATIASQELYSLIVNAVEVHRKAVRTVNPKLVVLNGIMLFGSLMEKLRNKAFADLAVQALYGSSYDQVNRDYLDELRP